MNPHFTLSTLGLDLRQQRGIHMQNTQVHSARVVYRDCNSKNPIVPMDPDAPVEIEPSSPPIWRWVISFLAVGACWGLTTPFMRRAAVIRDQQPKQQRPYPTSDAPWMKRKIWGVLYAVMDLLRNPAYAVPLLLNVTGSVWFFLLIGQAELSLTVPITNSLAFLFTVLGEWWAEGKVISRDTWIGMSLVLGGIALCVHAKTS